jgi:hypothetical protein
MIGSRRVRPITQVRRAFFSLLAVALLTACGRAFPPPIPTQGPLPNVDWLAYHDPTAGFSIQHPPTWQRVDNGGGIVVFELQAAPGTNLIRKTVEIDVRPAGADCKESTYGGSSGAPPAHSTVNGVDFLRETGIDIGAGNIHDWTSYSTLRQATCITLTFVLHSANAGVYSTEPAPFDRAAESAIFDEILNTFRFDP